MSYAYLFKYFKGSGGRLLWDGCMLGILWWLTSLRIGSFREPFYSPIGRAKLRAKFPSSLRSSKSNPTRRNMSEAENTSEINHFCVFKGRRVKLLLMKMTANENEVNEPVSLAADRRKSDSASSPGKGDTVGGRD